MCACLHVHVWEITCACEGGSVGGRERDKERELMSDTLAQRLNSWRCNGELCWNMHKHKILWKEGSKVQGQHFLSKAMTLY